MPFLLFSSLFSFLSLISPSSAHTITLSLTPSAAAPPHTNPWQRLNHLAAASAIRAPHLKTPKTNSSATNVPVFPRAYGGYSISLSYGTPPQTLSFVIDTGSSLVWFPCTKRYSCSSCNFQNVNPANISTFKPKLSSSSKIVGCKNPKCRWIFPDVQCRNCDNSTTCTEFCPPYIIQYGSGSTTGLLLSETLSFGNKSVENFVVGCSVFSSRQPSGIAGFGRGSESLPAQMGLKKFSYCLVSHRFDDTPVSSDLVLGSGAAAAAEKKRGINYTPFSKNPTTGNSAFQDYYYVTLKKITVGAIRVKVPQNFLQQDSAGNGGAVLDSGTTFTFMENHVFEPVAQEFEMQVGKNYSRAVEIENQSGLRPCFNVSGESSLALPELSFHFKGGKRMELPLADYFSFLGDSVVCLTIVTNNVVGGGVGPGPAIILGNYQQQNFYVEYDLGNDRLGFGRHVCK